MIHRIVHALAAVACVVALAACGGGGGSAGTTGTGTKSPATGTGGSSGSPDGTPDGGGPAPQMTVALRDTLQNPVTHIFVVGGFTARATLRDAQ